MNRILRPLLLIAFLLGVAWPLASDANVTITEKLLMLDSKTRYADATLINAAAEPVTYEMSWRFFKMEEGTGEYITVSAPVTDFDISKYIVFTPRRITLMPRSSQKVRLAMRMTGNPPAPGDYRAHFEFREVKSNMSDLLPDHTINPNSTAGVRINVGFSIPVIYRVGESNVTAKIGNVSTRLAPHGGHIQVVVPVTKSQDPYTLLGNLEVYYKPADGPEKLVGQISNANLFPEITERTLPVTLNIASLSSGALHVVLKNTDPAKMNQVIDEKMIPIGQ